MLRTLSLLTLAAAAVLACAYAWTELDAGSAVAQLQHASVGQWGPELPVWSAVAACLLAGGFACILGPAVLRLSRPAAPSPARDALQARFDAMLAQFGQGVAIYDRHERLVVANAHYCKLCALAPDEVRPGTFFRDMLARSHAAGYFPGLAADDVYASRKRCILTRTAATMVEEPLPGLLIQVQIQPLEDGGWLAILDDVTAHRNAKETAAFLARHDVLTSLPNRAMLRDRLEQELARASRGQPFAVMLLDLDRFKDVNDLFGHPAGDRLLQLAGERIQACMREVDLVARLDGDEFAVVVAEAALPESAGRIAERITAAFAEPFELASPGDDGQSSPCLATVGVSIGIAVAPGDGASTDALLRHADMALHRAKAEHRGTARFFEPVMDASHLARRQAEHDLRLALDRNELRVFYQPLVSLQTGAIVGFEALLRWQHPTRGLVPPIEFIPLAEETGLILPIGEWVVRTACRDATAWPPGIGVAVNLSAVQFRDPLLVQTIQAALAGSGLAATRLELEITESVLLHDSPATLAMLHALRALGVRVAMDDFGTGYSSLSYLHSFPFDKIKIDRMFICDVLDRVSSGAIVRAIAGLGASLGIATTAEGVETQEQLLRLRLDGCTEAQGYLFSRPVPVSEIGALLAAGGQAIPCPALQPLLA
ncbi:MAG: putative bifunctional diguanylate cyclase/phosphodiesterase [Janthinobacterium lividum]